MFRIGLLCVLVALSVSAEEALVRGCRLELEQAAVAIAPQVFYPGWVSRTPDGGWKPDDAGRRSWTFRDKASAEVAFEGTGQYEVRADGVLKVTYGWKRRLAAPVIYAAVGMRLPCARYGGGTVLVNGKPITLPIQKSPKVMLWSGSLTNLVCRDAQVRRAIRREMGAAGVVSGNVFALAATRAAYTDCDAWLDGLKAYLVANRDFACAYMAEHMPKIRVTPLEATYLMWLDCRALGLSQKTLLARIREAGVRVNDGLFFGEAGRGFIRLNIACPRAQLAAALERMAKALG